MVFRPFLVAGPHADCVIVIAILFRLSLSKEFLYRMAHIVSAIFPSSSGRKCHPMRRKADWAKYTNKKQNNTE